MFDPETIRTHWKKLLTLLVVSVVLLILLVTALTRSYLSVTVVGYIPDVTGVVITDDGGNDIRLSSSESSHFLLPHGSYVVKVGAGDMHTQQAIDIGLFNFKSITITLHETKPLTPLTNINTSDINPYADGKKFIDTTVRRLTFIDNDDRLQYIGPLSVGLVRWFDAERGLIVSRSADGSLQLSVIDHEDIRQILVPDINNIETISAAIIDSTSAYITADNKLYRYSDDNITLVDTLNIPSVSLSSASKDYILLSGQITEDGTPIQTLTLYNIHSKQSKDIPVVSMSARYGGVTSSWSSDGEMFSVSSGGTVSIYNKAGDPANLAIPANTITATGWDKNTLVFASDNVLWSYDKDNKTLTATSKLLPYIVIDSIIAHNNTYYIRADQQSGTVLYRYTDSNKADDIGDMLAGSDMRILPPACFINFLNYTKKSIVLFDSGTNEGACIESIRAYLDVFQIGSDVDTQINKDDSFGRTS